VAKHADVNFSIFKWFVFVVGLGLVPLWLPALARYLSELPVELLRTLRFGALVFYGYSVALGVVRERWGELFVRWARTHDIGFRDIASFIYELVVPLIVVLLSFSTFWAILDKNEPSNRVILPQVISAILALGSSLTHSIWVSKVHKAHKRYSRVAR